MLIIIYDAQAQLRSDRTIAGGFILLVAVGGLIAWAYFGRLHQQSGLGSSTSSRPPTATPYVSSASGPSELPESRNRQSEFPSLSTYVSAPCRYQLKYPVSWLLDVRVPEREAISAGISATTGSPEFTKPAEFAYWNDASPDPGFKNRLPRLYIRCPSPGDLPFDPSYKNEEVVVSGIKGRKVSAARPNVVGDDVFYYFAERSVEIRATRESDKWLQTLDFF